VSQRRDASIPIAIAIPISISMTPTRYVLPPVGDDIPPLPEAVESFKEALAEARVAEDRLREVLTVGGWLK
jgi:predicted metallo-beta-lactamase superfamily hydrolase